ncbi:NAD(P)H-binding protein [Actinokineospora pegani]|uniref:NAD(P)H-binding protein n=1 Tax=Actinokineospora pegani TaxID=2654637 RepID=UPI0012EA929F|nr:NAD(P)H-binding protein [Actinokineospora pegani]
MRILIAGGHGKIALELTKLAARRGDTVIGLVRNPDHVQDIRDLGGDATVIDLESASKEEVAATLAGADAAVFAAGAGPGSGPDRKDSVDRAASTLLADAAIVAGVKRLVQISSTGIDRADDPDVDEVFATYLRAKGAAEQDLRARDLEWTILRPGRLTDDPPTGKVALTEQALGAEVTRADVAAVVLALLDEPKTAGRTLELVNGDTAVPDAVSALV